MGEARPLNLLTIAAWLTSTCLHPCPFCLRLGNRALAPCVDNGKRVQSKQVRQIWQVQHVTKARKLTNKQERKDTRKQTKGGVHKGQMQVWIECPQLHCVEAWTTHQQARLMHGHVIKCVEMHIKPTGGTNKHGKHNIARSRKGER